MAQKTTVNDAYETLKSEVENQKRGENEKFTTEIELMKRFNLSRTSIREVLSRLVNDGFLYRKKNKGVYINKKIINNNSYIKSFTERLRERGQQATSRVLEIKKVIPPDIARLSLGLSEVDFCYFLKRLRFSDGEPIAVEIIYTPESIVPAFEKYDFEHDSFYRVLREECGKEFSYDKEIISAVPVAGETAELLYGRPEGFALQVVDVLYDIDYKPLEYSESWFHSTKYSYLSISVNH